MSNSVVLAVLALVTILVPVILVGVGVPAALLCFLRTRRFCSFSRPVIASVWCLLPVLGVLFVFTGNILALVNTASGLRGGGFVPARGFVLGSGVVLALGRSAGTSRSIELIPVAMLTALHAHLQSLPVMWFCCLSSVPFQIVVAPL